jgi:sulfur-carrier protein
MIMAVTFIIPGPLLEFTGNQHDVVVDSPATTLADALARLWQVHPGLRDRVLTERGEVRPHVNLFVDGEMIRYRGELQSAVRDGSEVVILPAVSGG